MTVAWVTSTGTNPPTDPYSVQAVVLEVAVEVANRLAAPNPEQELVEDSVLQMFFPDIAADTVLEVDYITGLIISKPATQRPAVQMPQDSIVDVVDVVDVVDAVDAADVAAVAAVEESVV
jgi:hypothetical protein